MTGCLEVFYQPRVLQDVALLGVPGGGVVGQINLLLLSVERVDGIRLVLWCSVERSESAASSPLIGRVAAFGRSLA